MVLSSAACFDLLDNCAKINRNLHKTNCTCQVFHCTYIHTHLPPLSPVDFPVRPASGFLACTFLLFLLCLKKPRSSNRWVSRKSTELYNWVRPSACQLHRKVAILLFSFVLCCLPFREKVMASLETQHCSRPG